MKRLLGILLALTAVSSFAQDAPQTCGYPGVAFINGINTSDDQAVESAAQLQEALTRKTGTAVPVEVAFNKSISGVGDVIESLYQKGLTYNERTEDVSRRIYGAIHGRDEMLRDAPAGFLGDLQFAVNALVTKATELFARGKPAYDTTLLETTQAYRRVLANNPGLYVVAHSQGTLFANDSMYMLDTTDLALGQAKREHSGSYFVAPAAASLYAPFVRGYTKARTDLLATLLIGLGGNADLYANEHEKEAWGTLGDPKMHHGFLTSYMNAELAGHYDGVVKSPPHWRMYERVVNEMAADLEALKTPCPEPGATWKLPVNTQEMFVFKDVLMYRDAFFCAQASADFGAPLPADRGTCMSQYSPTVEFIYDSAGGRYPVDSSGVCQDIQGARVCSLALRPSPTEILSYYIAATPATDGTTCGTGAFEVMNVATNARRCLDWTQALALIRTIP